jgi:hypothetical protein
VGFFLDADKDPNRLLMLAFRLGAAVPKLWTSVDEQRSENGRLVRAIWIVSA